MKKIVLLILISFSTSISFAQIHEVGFFVGGSNFIGDVGRTNYIYPNNVAGGLVYKYNLNPRIAIRGTYTYLPIKGDNKNRESVANEAIRSRKFNNNLHEFAAGIEFNFYEYDISKRNKEFTPYIVAEFAVFTHKIAAAINNQNQVTFKNKTSYSIPVGLGIKGRIIDGLAYAIEGRLQYAFTDELDYTTERIPQLSFGGTGKDWYVFTGISLVYSFGRPPCYSNFR